VTDKRSGPGRRRGDQGLLKRLSRSLPERAYRDVWLILITGLVAWSLIGIQNTVNDQRDGRKYAVNVVCGATSAVIDAGRATITGGGVGPPEFVRNLEALGYPPKRVREAQAQKAAEQYAELIARRVERVAGARDVVKPNGTLDCVRLTELARTEP
jgi:hypothetical protein